MANLPINLCEKWVRQYLKRWNKDWSISVEEFMALYEHEQSTLHERLSESHKGKEAWNKGKTGMPWSGRKRPDHSAKMSGEGNPFYGKHHTQETKDKIHKTKFETLKKKHPNRTHNKGMPGDPYNLCGDDISKIENYELAKADNFKGWDIHHRLEHELNVTKQDLIDWGIYYDRPADELIYLTRSQHTTLHMKIKYN